jgi:hypothetical protein
VPRRATGGDVNDPNWTCCSIPDGGPTDGHVGPLSVAEPKILGAAFKTALHLAAKTGSSQVSAFLPGTSDVALSIAVEHGMRITFPMVLVSTHDFGNWAQYLPRNPGFM